MAPQPEDPTAGSMGETKSLTFIFSLIWGFLDLVTPGPTPPLALMPEARPTHWVRQLVKAQ